MRVLAFVQKAPGISPGQRFRIEQWAPHLAKDHGIDVDFAPFDSPELTKVLYQPGQYAKKGALMLGALARRQRDVRRARRYDVAYVYREVASLGPAFYERVLDRIGVPYVLDFDDAIWMSSGANAANGLFSKLRFPGKTAAAARHARAVTVGNAYLAEWARQHNDSVHIVPTTIDLSRYTVQPPREPDGIFRVVWMGSFSTLKYLELVRAPIEKLGSERAVELRVVCDRPLERPFAGITNTFVKWTAENEARDIGAADVGIMPLDDTPWSRGKCGCKALQYMAAGRPAIVSPVGVNADVVSEGESGLHATSHDQWYAALRRVADDRGFASTLVVRGRYVVEKRYSADAGARALASALAEVRLTPPPCAAFACSPPS
jgi:glycosyltransferase involved in cell wall biosynthesis